MVITTAQLHSKKPELRFCAGSNPARGVSEIRDGEDLWQWSPLEIRLNAFRRSTYHKNNSSSSSGFRTKDSCIREYIAITHSIFKSFNTNPSLEVCCVFLDLSKALENGLMVFFANSKVMVLTETSIKSLNNF